MFYFPSFDFCVLVHLTILGNRLSKILVLENRDLYAVSCLYKLNCILCVQCLHLLGLFIYLLELYAAFLSKDSKQLTIREQCNF